MSLCLVVASSLLLGGLTSLAQGFLPEALSSFANSASGWTILSALILWFIRGRTALSALLGGIGFVGLVVGYTVVSQMRGIYYSPVLFGVIGLVVGPFVGVAASWLHSRGWRAASAVALLSGIGIGEMNHGLTVVGDTTHPLYWILVGVVGAALLVVVVVRRLDAPMVRISAVAATAAVACAFVYAYSLLGSA
ncbi:hypothetical protein EAX62_07330 [Tessaracoccus antarcticus]|uniref:Uncharacterized protein n=1 Tax=Tessaracoccus antarcticus TaxID=2479848 RepID=A0A3M0G5C2_9ACTN|nr:hypothetical protein EAX62_07330 [Tessaracoccus antarcticus]